MKEGSEKQKQWGKLHSKKKLAEDEEKR